MDRKPLTTRQSEVYDFIEMRIVIHGKPPTCREICDQFGFSSPNAAHQYIAVLIKKGWLRRDPDISRGIRLNKSPWQELRIIAKEVYLGAVPAHLGPILRRLDTIHRLSRDSHPESAVYQPESKREAIESAVDATSE